MSSRSKLQKLSIACLLSSIVPSAAALAMGVTAAHGVEVFPRDPSCANPSHLRCDDIRLPFNFCCPKSSTCISLDDASSALCCPDGECNVIEPIVCDVSLQDVTENPDNPLMTTKLDEDLPKCGKSCCPHGYSCEDGKNCRRKKAKSTKSTQTTTSSTSSTSSTRTTQTASLTTAPTDDGSTVTATATLFLFPTAGSEIPEASSSLSANCPAFPGRAIAAGFFPGLITGSLITLIAIICLGRRRRKQELKRANQSKSGHFRNRSADGAIVGISDPMPSQFDNSVRTDFLRHSPSYDGGASANNTKSRFYRTGSRVKSFFNGSPKPSHTRNVYQTSTPPPPIPPIYKPNPSTPPEQVHPQRQPSTESIKVYSPEHIVQGHGSLRPGWTHPNERPTTTFTEMMERVGFQSSNGSPHFKVTVTPPTQSSNSPT